MQCEHGSRTSTASLSVAGLAADHSAVSSLRNTAAVGVFVLGWHQAQGLALHLGSSVNVCGNNTPCFLSRPNRKMLLDQRLNPKRILSHLRFNS